jgi:hypothetical protein
VTRGTIRKDQQEGAVKGHLGVKRIQLFLYMYIYTYIKRQCNETHQALFEKEGKRKKVWE